MESDASWQQQVAAAREAARRRRPRFQMERTLLFLAGALLIAFSIFLGGIGFGVQGDDVKMLGIAALTVLLASVPLAINQGLPRQERHIFIALLSLILVGRYVTPVFTAYIPATGPIDAPGMSRSNLMPDDLITGQLFVLLGFSVLFVVYATPVGRFIADQIPKPRIDWPNSTILIVALAMMGLGWPLRIAGGLGVIPEELGSGVISTLIDGTIFCNAILMLAWLRHRSFFAAGLLAFNVLMGGTIGLLTGSKQEMLIRPAIAAITWVLVRRTIRLRWVAIGVVAVSLVYPASQFIKYSGRRGLVAFSNPTETLRSIADYASGWGANEWFQSGLEATTQRVDSLGVASVLIRDTPRVSPFQYGATLKLFFVAFVPRGLWPNKPTIGIGLWVTSVYGSGPGFAFHTAPSQIGEFYMNFGILGVIAGFALIGTIIRLTHETLMWRGGTAASILALTVILFRYTIGFDSGIAQSYAGIIFAIVPAGIAHLVARLLLPTCPQRPDAGT